MTDKITLPKETQERIKQDAETMALVSHDLIDADSWETGATAEATRALPLLEALEMIGLPTLGSGSLSYPMGFQEWIDTARDIAKKAVIKYNQQP